jgi:DNA processing protein
MKSAWPEIRDLENYKWPKSLCEIPKKDIPKKLRIIGTEPDWNQKRICIIGSRKSSDYGLLVCEKLINKLSNYPITIVSGLAYGIDSHSHKLALENKMNIIVIPGSGLDRDSIYPKRHIDLAEKILAADGCLISEFDDNQPATIWTFPQRNRIMAAISDLVLIIEADEKSGTMITARLALDYNIEVAVVPGSIFNQNSRGTNKLLKEGAQPITCAEDILEILDLNKSSGDIFNQKLFNESLGPSELKILNLLKNPLTKDELVERSNVEISELNKILSALEIEGLIHKIGDKICQK